MKNKLLLVFSIAASASLFSFAGETQQQALETAKSNTSANVGFLKVDSPSQQEQAAQDFFTTNYGSENVISASDIGKIDASEFDCIWIHVDNDGIESGTADLPAQLVSEDLVKAIKSYIEDGGSLYLSGHATRLLSTYGRIDEKFAPNIIGSGLGGDSENDKWVISVEFAGKDNSTHPIFSNLESTDVYTHKNFGMLWGGGNNYWRNDHNCLWDLNLIANNENLDYEGDNNVFKYQNATKSNILASWGQVTDAAVAGLIEFYPTSESAGKIIANGLAACQWGMREGDTNYYGDNLRLLTANILSYLAPKPVEPADLSSTDRVALFVGYDSEQEANFDGNKEGEAIYDYFKSKYPQNIIFKNDIDNISTENYDCLWIRFDRDDFSDKNAIEAILPEGFIEKVKKFHEEGGNIYLSKQAIYLIDDIDSELPAPTEIGQGNSNPDLTNDTWYANVNHNGKDYSNHPIFSNMNIVNNQGLKMIIINSGENTNADHTTMWNMSGMGFESFCSTYNCDVLATWGHNIGDAMNYAGIVEFKPRKADPDIQTLALTPDDVENRKGTIIANGLGGIEWAPAEGENKSLDQVKLLTSNILAYLSPYAYSGVWTGIEDLDAEEYDSENSVEYYNIQGVRVVNPTSGLYIKVTNGKASKFLVK